MFEWILGNAKPYTPLDQDQEDLEGFEHSTLEFDFYNRKLGKQIVTPYILLFLNWKSAIKKAIQFRRNQFLKEKLLNGQHANSIVRHSFSLNDRGESSQAFEMHILDFAAKKCENERYEQYDMILKSELFKDTTDPNKLLENALQHGVNYLEITLNFILKQVVKKPSLIRPNLSRQVLNCILESEKEYQNDFLRNLLQHAYSMRLSHEFKLLLNRRKWNDDELLDLFRNEFQNEDLSHSLDIIELILINLSKNAIILEKEIQPLLNSLENERRHDLLKLIFSDSRFKRTEN